VKIDEVIIDDAIIDEMDIAECIEEILKDAPPKEIQQQMVDMVKRLTDIGVPESEATKLVFEKIERKH